jgi:tetratricopeptide (TPR) repeat protein
VKNRVIKSNWIILLIVLFFLFSYTSAQQKQIESRDAEFYNNRGKAYYHKGQYDQAISDFTKALEINPRDDRAYYNRGFIYYLKKEYDKSWEDVKKAQILGYQISPKFIEDLRKASGRQN